MDAYDTVSVFGRGKESAEEEEVEEEGDDETVEDEEEDSLALTFRMISSPNG